MSCTGAVRGVCGVAASFWKPIKTNRLLLPRYESIGVVHGRPGCRGTNINIDDSFRHPVVHVEV